VKQDLLFRTLLIIAWALVALIAQIIMQRAAASTRDLIFSQNIARYISASAQIGMASGASLVMTFLCYRNMTFMQFLLSQSLFYILAFMYAFVILNEPINLWRFLAILCFIPGLLIALGNK
jgi:drug/metabolite transporter (DMT)-like permease